MRAQRTFASPSSKPRRSRCRSRRGGRRGCRPSALGSIGACATGSSPSTSWNWKSGRSSVSCGHRARRRDGCTPGACPVRSPTPGRSCPGGRGPSRRARSTVAPSGRGAPLISSTTAGSASVVVSPSDRVLGDVAEQAAHDLAAPRLRQLGGEDDVGRLRRSGRSSGRRGRAAPRASPPSLVALQRHVGDDRLTGHPIRATAHGGLGDGLVVDERARPRSSRSGCPETFITSSTRPRSQKSRSSSTRAPSPAK